MHRFAAQAPNSLSHFHLKSASLASYPLISYIRLLGYSTGLTQSFVTMNRPNRPRNRQPRPPRQNQNQNRQGQNNQRGSSSRAPATPQQAAGTVPTVQQVVPGASVFIILKEDQPTGEETQGIVQDILTRGNHPRGIKVRLRDGQVGRVQRMGNSSAAAEDTGAKATPSSRFTMRYTDVRRDDEFASEPPPRSLADFMPDLDERLGTAPSGVEAVKCPFCEDFEGDETAVTVHIDREHLS